MGNQYKRAIQVPYRHGDGQPMGGERNRKHLYVHAEGADRDQPNPVDLAHYMNRERIGAYHFLIALHGPHTGQVVQMLPADKGAYAMGGYSDKTPGGFSLNRYGKRGIAVCVVGVEQSPKWRNMSLEAKVAWLQLLHWIKNQHGVPMYSAVGVPWGRKKESTIRKFMNRDGVWPHGGVPFQWDRSDGMGHGLPLGIVRKGDEQAPLHKMIKHKKRKLRR